MLFTLYVLVLLPVPIHTERPVMVVIASAAFGIGGLIVTVAGTASLEHPLNVAVAL